MVLYKPKLICAFVPSTNLAAGQKNPKQTNPKQMLYLL